MARLFVAHKPPFVSSNRFLGQLKRRYGVRSAGFSGTLDPIASGCLIIAFGPYTRLFQYLAKTPKRYRATLYLGACSDTLDLEAITHINPTTPLKVEAITQAMADLTGDQMQLPPRFSALKVEGRRAYDLARSGEAFELKARAVTIDTFKLSHYAHPFLTFEASVSEGTYIRTLAGDLAHKLGTTGALTYLERLSEGKLHYENERALDPLSVIDLPRNHYLQDPQDLYLGRVLRSVDFEQSDEGVYLVETEDFFVIIEIIGDRAHYRLGRMPHLC